MYNTGPEVYLAIQFQLQKCVINSYCSFIMSQRLNIVEKFHPDCAAETSRHLTNFYWMPMVVYLIKFRITITIK